MAAIRPPRQAEANRSERIGRSFFRSISKFPAKSTLRIVNEISGPTIHSPHRQVSFGHKKPNKIPPRKNVAVWSTKSSMPGRKFTANPKIIAKMYGYFDFIVVVLILNTLLGSWKHLKEKLGKSKITLINYYKRWESWYGILSCERISSHLTIPARITLDFLLS